MKIGSFPANVIPLTNDLKARRSEGEGGAGRQQYDPNQTKKEKREQPDPEQMKQELDQALHKFQEDADTQAQGLSAVAEGNGPGLRIHVKDRSGATVRQFSGEEFLRLREAASGLPRGPGKILDQKF